MRSCSEFYCQSGYGFRYLSYGWNISVDCTGDLNHKLFKNAVWNGRRELTFGQGLIRFGDYKILSAMNAHTLP